MPCPVVSNYRNFEVVAEVSKSLLTEVSQSSSKVEVFSTLQAISVRVCCCIKLFNLTIDPLSMSQTPSPDPLTATPPPSPEIRVPDDQLALHRLANAALGAASPAPSTASSSRDSFVVLPRQQSRVLLPASQTPAPTAVQQNDGARPDPMALIA